MKTKKPNCIPEEQKSTGRSFKKNLAVAAFAASLGISLGVPVQDVLAADENIIKQDEKNVSSVQGKIESNQGKLKSAQGKIESNQIKIDSRQGKFKADQGKIESIQGKFKSDQGKWESNQVKGEITEEIVK